jgi:Zn-dependent protease with chaperone function
LTEGSVAARVALALLVVGFFVALAAAFWRRSWVWGLVVLNAGTLLKVIWSVAFGGAAGWASLVPSIFTLVVTDAVILLAVRFLKRHRERQAGTRRRTVP